VGQNDRQSDQQSKLEKLQSMKMRLSMMKSGENSVANRPTAPTMEQPTRAVPPSSGGASGGSSNVNMNTSFSAMNSSLSQKWMSKKS